MPSAHRRHGAIGLTIECVLNHLTRSLMGWRREFGGDTFWAEQLGQRVAGFGGHGLWRGMAARTDRMLGWLVGASLAG